MNLRNTLATATLAVSFVIAGVTAADAAVVIPGTGYAGLAGNGNTGTDAWGQPWKWNATKGGYGVAAGLAAWGTPGLGAGTVDLYQGNRPATGFEISFVDPIATVNQFPSPYAGGYNESTRFDVCNPNCVEWTPVFVSKDQIDFLAPAGTSLTKGEKYFVNVIFNEKASAVNGFTTGFSAVFTAAPEPTTWAMMLLGVAMIGFIARRRSETAAAAA